MAASSWFYQAFTMTTWVNRPFTMVVSLWNDQPFITIAFVLIKNPFVFHTLIENRFVFAFNVFLKIRETQKSQLLKAFDRPFIMIALVPTKKT